MIANAIGSKPRETAIGAKKVTVNKTIYMESIKMPKTKHTKIIKANIAQGDKPKGLDEKNPHHFCKSAGSLMR